MQPQPIIAITGLKLKKFFHRLRMQLSFFRFPKLNFKVACIDAPGRIQNPNFVDTRIVINVMTGDGQAPSTHPHRDHSL